MNHYYNVRCPSCLKKNWIDNGDTEDLTVMDVEAFICWNCKETAVLSDGEFGEINSIHMLGESKWDDKRCLYDTEGLEKLE